MTLAFSKVVAIYLIYLSAHSMKKILKYTYKNLNQSRFVFLIRLKRFILNSIKVLNALKIEVFENNLLNKQIKFAK